MVEPPYDLPVPDALPQVARRDKVLTHARELHPLVHHAVAQMQGIDVSHYQGNINWDGVAREENVKFAYIKATEGGNLVDACYTRNLIGAKRVDIPVGVYHFFRPSVSPLVQLENFRSVVDPHHQDLIPIIDVEVRGRVSLAQFHHRLKAMLEGVERMFGVKPIIYTGVNFYAKYLKGRYKNYRFMVARYAEEFPGLCEDVPILIWQYSSTAQVQGIEGDVDRSVFLDNYSLADILLPVTSQGKK